MSLTERVRAFNRWLFIDPSPIWLAILAPGVTLLVAWPVTTSSESRVRIAGFLVTLLGGALVLKGITGTQHLFNKPRLYRRVTAWLRRLPPIFARRGIIHAAGFAVTASATVSARGHVRVNPKDPSSVSSRVDAIEENLRRVDDRISQVETRVDQEVKSVRELVDSERSERARGHPTLDARLEEAAAGDLDLELVGVWWLIVGQVLGSFPEEIGRVLWG